MALGWALQRMSRNQYLQILDQMNSHATGNYAVLDAIRAKLLPQEDMLTFIQAQDGNSKLDCLLVLTDRNLISGRKTQEKQVDLEIIRFEDLLFAGYRQTRRFGRLDVWQGKKERHFNCRDKDVMDVFGEAFVKHFDSWYKSSAHRIEMEVAERSNGPRGQGDSLHLDELERLANLWKSGALSDSEFQLAKDKLLAQ